MPDTIYRPRPRFECIEEAIDPKLYEQLQEDGEQAEAFSNESPWQSPEDQIKDKRAFPKINKKGQFPCLHPPCGRGANFGMTGYDIWDGWIGEVKGKVYVGQGEYCASHSDYRPLFGDCPECEGKGYVTWEQFKKQYDLIMHKYEAELGIYEEQVEKAEQAIKKLTEEELNLIRNLSWI